MKQRKIALTGGIATGKSTVAKMFSELGAVILDADQVAREVVEPGSPCWQKLKDFLGESFFAPDGRLKRQKLRQCIIEDPQCRSRVNAILHPAIMAAMEQKWQELRHTSPPTTVIFDIPLLFEAGLAHRFDTIILVYAPPAIQIQRLMARDGISRSEAEQTLTMQLPIDSKKAKAHIVIDNSQDPADTLRQVKAAIGAIGYRL